MAGARETIFIMKAAAHPIYNGPFALVCLSSLFFSASFNMLIPELPAYLSSLGGAEYKGLIIALFTLTAGLSRPFSGKLTDSIGRVPVMAVGSLVCFVCGFLYPVLTSVSGFLLLRLVHGFSTGFKPTATAAYVADLVPVGRWGEAMGIHGLFFSTGMALGPALGSTIVLFYSMDVLFYASSFLAMLSIVILYNMKETLPDKQRFNLRHLQVGRHDIFEWKVFPAALVTFLSYLSYGAILTLVPDWGDYIGIHNKGLFFMVFTIASLVVRFVAGKVSDRRGRETVIRGGLIMLVCALVVIASWQSSWGLLAGGVIYGIATGILSPGINAWTVDMSDPEKRGKAMATMYIALEVGIGLGALVAGAIYQDQIKRIPVLFYSAAVITLIAIVYMYWRKKNA
jgi:MFS family permease